MDNEILLAESFCVIYMEFYES